MEGDKKEFEISIRNANPPPTIDWYIGSHKLTERDNDIEIRQSGAPKSSSFSQTIRYTAQHGHNGQQLSVVVKQTDENNNVLEQKSSLTTLFVAVPVVEPPKTLGIGIIAVIVSIACFILLALILLFVAFRTGRFCFKNASHTVLVKEVEAPKPDQSSMETQANISSGVSCGVGADFGPDKPIRTYSREQLDNVSGENVPLIVNENSQGKAISVDASTQDKAINDVDLKRQAQKLEAMLKGSEDELKNYEYEGNESLCSSLSSINTDVPEEDWEETFKALGPKFQKLSDMINGDDSEEEGKDDDSKNNDEVDNTKEVQNVPISSYKQIVSQHTSRHTMSSTRRFIQTVNIKQSSIQHYSQNSSASDSGVSHTPSSAVNGGDESSTDGTEI